jgi:thioredoxin 1
MGIVELTKDNFDEEVLASPVPVLIDFWADWCGPCKMQSPIIDQVAEELGDQVKVCKVNVDVEASIALNYRIVSIPTLVFMNKGEFQQRMVGLQDKAAIISYLETLL